MAMRFYIALVLVASISIQKALGTSDEKSDATITGKKRFGFPFHNFLLNSHAYKNDDKDDDDDSNDKGYYTMCPPQLYFPTEQKCRAGSVKDKDKKCDTRTCIFYPSVGFTVRPSYFDLFNIPQYYRYMFSKQIVNPSPYGSMHGGFGQNPYFPQMPGFPQSGFPQPGFPQQTGFPPQQPTFPQTGFPHQPSYPPQQPFNQYGQNIPPYSSPTFPTNPFGQQNPNNFPSYNPYQQNNQPTYQQNQHFQHQMFPSQTGFPAQNMGPLPPPPPPPPPPHNDDGTPSSSQNPKRSLFFPGLPTGQFPQQYGGNSFGQTPFIGYGQNFHGGNVGGSNMFGASGPIIARFCKSPGQICQCESEDDCKCDADRPKVCTQKYADDGRYFWVYEWVIHRNPQHNPVNPHPQNQHPSAHSPQGVPTNHDNGFETPVVKSGQSGHTGHTSGNQQSYVPHGQNDHIDYSQPVQPVQQTQPSGSYQLRQRFLYFQRPNGCDCAIPKPGQSPSFGFFS